MSQDQFKHYDLTLVEPNFKSNLTDLIIELDYLRKKPLGGSTPVKIFFQLKHEIFPFCFKDNKIFIATYRELPLSVIKDLNFIFKKARLSYFFF